MRVYEKFTLKQRTALRGGGGGATSRSASGRKVSLRPALPKASTAEAASRIALRRPTPTLSHCERLTRTPVTSRHPRIDTRAAQLVHSATRRTRRKRERDDLPGRRASKLWCNRDLSPIKVAFERTRVRHTASLFSFLVEWKQTLWQSAFVLSWLLCGL